MKNGGIKLEKTDITKQLEYIKKVKELNKEKKLKYYILTMGCQLNENDSEKLCGMVEEMGYQPTEDYKEFLNGEVRYNALARMNPERAEELFAKSEEAAKERYAYLNKLVTLYGNDAE